MRFSCLGCVIFFSSLLLDFLVRLLYLVIHPFLGITYPPRVLWGACFSRWLAWISTMEFVSGPQNLHNLSWWTLLLQSFISPPSTISCQPDNGPPLQFHCMNWCVFFLQILGSRYQVWVLRSHLHLQHASVVTPSMQGDTGPSYIDMQSNSNFCHL